MCQIYAVQEKPKNITLGLTEIVYVSKEFTNFSYISSSFANRPDILTGCEA